MDINLTYFHELIKKISIILFHFLTGTRHMSLMLCRYELCLRLMKVFISIQLYVQELKEIHK